MHSTCNVVTFLLRFVNRT